MILDPEVFLTDLFQRLADVVRSKNMTVHHIILSVYFCTCLHAMMYVQLKLHFTSKKMY